MRNPIRSRWNRVECKNRWPLLGSIDPTEWSWGAVDGPRHLVLQQVRKVPDVSRRSRQPTAIRLLWHKIIEKKEAPTMSTQRCHLVENTLHFLICMKTFQSLNSWTFKLTGIKLKLKELKFENGGMGHQWPGVATLTTTAAIISSIAWPQNSTWRLSTKWENSIQI